MVSVSALRVTDPPTDVTSFVGRRRELAEIRRLLSVSRLVTLIGVGGVGKTRLALRAAEELRRTFRDGAWFVDLASLRDEIVLAETVAAALGLRDHSVRWTVRALCGHLAGVRALLVLDNCEHLVDACAVLADAVLRNCPEVRILLTSRQALRISGEHLLSVPSLSVPDPGWLPSPQALAQYEAVSLFVERAIAVCPEFAITEANCAAVAGLCQRLEGIPLAIELAAVRMRALSVQQVLRRLENRYCLLTTGYRAAPPRHQTLQALMSWSFDLLTASEQRLWARLSVFAGRFDLEAAEHVCSGEEIPVEEALDLVTGLVDKSILSVEEHGGRMYYRLLETVREYGLEHLRDFGEDAVMWRRHRDWYTGLAARMDAEWFGPDQVQWCERLQAEHANLRVALQFCLAESSETQVGLGMATELLYYWRIAGQMSEGRSWLDRLLAADLTPSAARARALITNARMAALQSDTAAAGKLLDQGSTLARELGDAGIIAASVYIAGSAAMAQGDLVRAGELLRQAHAGFRAAGDLQGTTIALALLARTRCMLGDAQEETTPLFEEALQITRAHGERWWRAVILGFFCIEAWRNGDRGRAVLLARESAHLSRLFGEMPLLPMALLAWVAAADGQAERAARLCGALHNVSNNVLKSFQSSNVPVFWHLGGEHERCETELRRVLGEKAFHAAWQRGAGLTLDQAIAEALGEKIAQPAGPADPAVSPVHLTQRETQIAELVAQGLSNKEIATHLVIAQRTAETHVEHILTKLGFTSRTQIAVWIITERKNQIDGYS